MARAREPVIFLDTHIVVWLYSALEKKFPKKAKTAINTHQVYISSRVKLELQYLFEVGKIKHKPHLIVKSLEKSIGLKTANSRMAEVVHLAMAFDWTRDPFDRMLVAEAHLHNAYFITADKTIHQNYRLSVWE